MTTITLILVISVVWTILSVCAVGFAIWGSGLAQVEKVECRDDLSRLRELGIGNGRMTLALEEYSQSRRKRVVMHLFLAHQLLFLIVGVITLLVPASPILASVSWIVIIRHLGPSFMLLTAQALIVWSQILLTINTYRRHSLHAKYGSRHHDDEEA